MVFSTRCILSFLFVFFMSVSSHATNVVDLARGMQEAEEQYLQNGFEVDEFIPDIPNEILDYVQNIQKQTRSTTIDNFLEKAKEHPEMVAKFKRDRNTEGKIMVFASLSMPDAELNSLFSHASGKDDVFIHFRGIKPGDKISDFYKRIGERLRGINPKPNVLLDPVAFTDMAIDVVPVIVRKGKGDNYTNILYGSVNTDYFKDLLEAEPGKADYGHVGQVYKILEPNLIDLMKQRAVAIDWESKKKGIVENYWKKYNFVDPLPVAREKHSFLWNPALYLTEDVKGPDGEVIARKGTEYSPFDHGGFHRRIFVFDPTDPKQFEIVSKISSTKQEGLSDIFLVTKVDRLKGWEFLQEIQNKLKSNVYLMDQSGIERLRVQRVPSVIKPEGRKMRVIEYPVGVL